MASGNVAKLNIQLVANAQGILSGFSKAQGAILQFQSATSGMFASLGKLGGGLAFGGIAGFGLKLAADLEQARVGFQVMIGDAGKALQLLEKIREFADVTPFGFQGLRDTAGNLLAARIAVENIIPTLSILGDIARGDQERLNLIAKAYTDVANKGKLAGQEIRQFAENQVPLLPVLAEMFGKTTAEITKMSEQGQISFSDVQHALISMVQKSGTYSGMMEKQSQTLSGRWSTLVDTAKRLATTIGEALVPAAKNATEAFIRVVSIANSMASGINLNVVKVGLFVAAWAGLTAIGARVVSVVSAIISALRALTLAQTIQQALSGPRGIAMLAVGLAAAGVAAVAVNEVFRDTNSTLTEASAISKEAAAGVEKLRKSLAEPGKAIAMQEAAAHAEELEKQLEKLRQKGEQVRESLRLPHEVLVETALELKKLAEAGAVSGSTFERGIQKAKEEYLKAVQAVQDAKIEAAPGVGAVARGSREGFSAVQEANRQAIADRENLNIARKQLVAEEAATKWLEQIFNAVKKQEPIKVVTETL